LVHTIKGLLRCHTSIPEVGNYSSDLLLEVKT
jgi:hypothetical protein